MTSTAQARMEEVIAANPNIGRVRLEKLAGVSQAEARAFLQYRGQEKPAPGERKEIKLLKKRIEELSGQGVGIGRGVKTAQIEDMEAGS